MKYRISMCMTVGEIAELLRDQPQLLHIHHAEVIRRLCNIGLSPDQARKTWLFFAQKEFLLTEECSSTQLTLDMSDVSWGVQNGE